MTELIVFADAESLTVQQLKVALTNAHISSDVPTPLPDPLVTIQRVGGAVQNLVTDAPVLIVQAWSKDKATAHDLCMLARAHIHAMPGTTVNGTWVYKVTEVGGPGYFPDPDTSTPRYQFTVQMRTRGTAI